jgi:hypothetical protein
MPKIIINSELHLANPSDNISSKEALKHCEEDHDDHSKSYLKNIKNTEKVDKYGIIDRF